MPSTSQCYKHKYAEPDIFQQLNTSLEQTEKDAGGLGGVGLTVVVHLKAMGIELLCTSPT